MNLRSKKIITIFALTIFLAVGLFGFVLMDHSKNRMDQNCAASFVDKVECPEVALVAAFHHLEAYKTFAQTYIYQSYLLELLILLIIAFVFRSILFRWLSESKILAGLRVTDPELLLRQPIKLTRWLSLFETSPTR